LYAIDILIYLDEKHIIYRFLITRGYYVLILYYSELCHETNKVQDSYKELELIIHIYSCSTVIRCYSSD
jgi:hypothetical protein